MSKGNRKRRKAIGILAPAGTCSARKTNGEPCNASPIRGGNVCRMHGGSAPQVKAKAQERLQRGVPAMLRMLNELASDEDVPPGVRLNAIRDWLDRAGVDRKIEIELSSSSFEEMVIGVLSEVSGEVEVGNDQDYASRRDDGDVIAGQLVDDVETEALPPATLDRSPFPTPAPRERR